MTDIESIDLEPGTIQIATFPDQTVGIRMSDGYGGEKETYLCVQETEALITALQKAIRSIQE